MKLRRITRQPETVNQNKILYHSYKKPCTKDNRNIRYKDSSRSEPLPATFSVTVLTWQTGMLPDYLCLWLTVIKVCCKIKIFIGKTIIILTAIDI